MNILFLPEKLALLRALRENIVREVETHALTPDEKSRATKGADLVAGIEEDLRRLNMLNVDWKDARGKRYDRKEVAA